MNTYFFECEKHNGYWRQKAIKAMPRASVVVPVCGGYYGFAYYTDYAIWKNQK